jgi:hypothetical protein
MKNNTRNCLGFVVSILSITSAHSLTAAVRPQMQIIRNSARLTVTWTGGGVLERAETVIGPWTELPEATSPHAVGLPTTTAFFRVNASRFALRVATDGEGQGGVTSMPTGIDCGAACISTYAENTLVQLIAEPGANSVFAGWSGDCTGTDLCQVTMNGPRSVTATFAVAPAGGLVNGDFEQGPGIGWVEQPAELIIPADWLGVSAYQGQYVAWLGYAQDNRRSAAIGQQVTLPNTWPLYLNFAIWLYSEEICDTCCWDRFGFYVEGEAVVENPRLCNGNTGGDGWRPLSMDLGLYAGQTVWLVFEIAAGPNDPLASAALLDDMRLSSTPW